MGFNTNITICNDMFQQLEQHPDDFVEGINRCLHGGGEFGVGNHANGVTVHSSEHADITQLIAVGGNFSTRVWNGFAPYSHHTEEGQVELLRRWADSLGYRISRKPSK